MIKVLDSEKAKLIWDKMILNLNETSFYQSYEYSTIFSDKENSKFIYSDENGKKIYGFARESEKSLSMYFGPLMSNNVTLYDLVQYINEVKDYFNKDVIFSLQDSNIEKFNSLYPNQEIVWSFDTPLIDTTLPIETIISNSTENRRRIIRKGLVNISSDRIRDGKEYIEDFCKLYEKRMGETGGEVDVKADLLDRFLDINTNHLYVCVDKNKVIAGHVVFTFGNTMITRYNCFDSEYAKLSPAARIEFELIRKCCQDPNIDIYDMSGLASGENVEAKLKSINRYKESYNPTRVLRYQMVKLNAGGSL